MIEIWEKWWISKCAYLSYFASILRSGPKLDDYILLSWITFFLSIFFAVYHATVFSCTLLVSQFFYCLWSFYFTFFFLQPRSVSYTLWLDFDCASIIGFRLAECCKKKLPNIKFCLLDIAFDGSLQYLSLLLHL